MEEKILKIIEEINPDILKYEGNTMMEDGTVDSFEVIDIVAALEEEFDIEIDASLVVAENFANKDAIVKMMLSVLDA
ncbi:MAG: acyl carrier protein [Lachnospiraceae bacterium]|nr:acyl carrier protein [Lachnospiraceae bacterium]